MRRVQAVNRTRGRLLASRVGVADRWYHRLRGLLGRGGLAAGEGLLLLPCRSIHTLGMAFSIDVAFLDDAGRVVALHHALPPGRVTRTHRGARMVLELAVGALASTGTAVGDEIEIGATPDG